MEHREARGLLLDLVGGRLDRPARDAVNRHVSSCEDCRDWIEAHDLLAADLETPPLDGHPDSQLLALCAVRPEEQFEPDREDLRRHLAACWRCRHEIDLVRAAVVDARPVTASPAATAAPHRRLPQWAFALAASVAAVAIATVLVTGVLQGHVDRSRPSEVASAAAATAGDGHLGAPSEELSETEIEGTRVIETDGGLMISRTKIKGGAQVTIRAGTSVAFGNGFEIGQQARVSVGGPPAGSARKPRDAQNG